MRVQHERCLASEPFALVSSPLKISLDDINPDPRGPLGLDDGCLLMAYWVLAGRAGFCRAWPNFVAEIGPNWCEKTIG